MGAAGSGGARHRSGPPPLGDSKEWIDLPAEGCDLPAPTFPLVDPTDRELMLWKDLWTKPQANKWHEQGQAFEVALYVRRLGQAEQHDSAVTLGTLVRQMQDSLGLSVPGLRSARWRIKPTVIEVQDKGSSKILSARDRFKALPDGDSER